MKNSESMMKPLMLAGALSLLTLPLTAQTPQGVALFEEGRYEDAKRALSAQVNDPQALLTLGRIALLQNDYETAAGFLEKAVAKKPNDPDGHFWLGQAYGSQAQGANILRQASLAAKTKAEW